MLELFSPGNVNMEPEPPTTLPDWEDLPEEHRKFIEGIAEDAGVPIFEDNIREMYLTVKGLYETQSFIDWYEAKYESPLGMCPHCEHEVVREQRWSLIDGRYYHKGCWVKENGEAFEYQD